ncbi:MAG: CPBP family intramembrane metalloprotease [Clostridiales bacterium]|nr:CPBP family intramembrane metalloprotease [Clostridiales bacterium]
MGDNKDYDFEDNDLTQSDEIAISRMSDRSILSRCGLYLSLMTIAIFVVQIIAGIIVGGFFPEVADADWFNVVLTFVGIVGVGLPVYIKLMKKIPDSEKGEKSKISIWQFVGYFIVCIAATYISNLVGLFISAFIEIFKGFEVVNPLEDFMLNSNWVLLMIYAVIIAPIVEELIFRKILLDKLRRFGDLPAMLLTGFAFGIFHFNLSQFFYASVLGILFAYITIRTNRIIYSIVLHMMINFIGTVIAPFAATNQMAALYVTAWFFGTMIIGSILFIVNSRRILILKPEKPLVRKRDYIINLGTLLFLGIGLSIIVINIVVY